MSSTDFQDLSSIEIAGRSIGPTHPPYVIAEMSCNHNGSFNRACEIIRAAAEAGVDAVKLQTFTADTITLDHDGPDFRVEDGLWKGRLLHDLYDEAHTPWEWHSDLFQLGRELGISVFSAPFDLTAVDFLEELEAPAYKIASFEAVDLPLIEYTASTGKPLVISTGMATREEIVEAVQAARRGGCEQLAMLHCVSGYPTPPNDSNLRTIPALAELAQTVVGLSDHTTGTAVPVAGVSLGASLVEKHVTVRREEGGLDAAFSLEPQELETLCKDLYTAWEALGDVMFDRPASEEANTVFRRSLYVVRDVPAGQRLGQDDVRSIRPGFGLAPKHIRNVIGRQVARDVPRGTPVSEDLLEARPVDGWNT